MSLKMPKSKNLTECADCGNTSANWASVNRGVLICDDCYIIHRNLGREISQVKSIHKSKWSPSELQMVMDLCANGSNSIWEHNLINTSSSGFTASFAHTIRNTRKKPSFKDPIHPNKSDYIKAKYQNFAFIKKPNPKEDVDFDVCEQLHSSVRSSNLKASLRLLASNADPNYIHPDKGNTPLHIAAKFGQASQIELLFAYGADPLATDIDGKTSLDYAAHAQQNEILERLIECQFEITDRLSYFLCGRRPDHKQGQHYLIPILTDNLESTDLWSSARSKLQALSNRQFEELAKDIYDEVDRRELDEIWLQLNAESPNNSLVAHHIAPFLPVNPSFSSLRNQGRQKLARFSAKNFAVLLIDILIESKRRQLCSFTEDNVKSSDDTMNVSDILNSGDESDPLYDSVASDSDYDFVEQEDTKRKSKFREKKCYIDDKDLKSVLEKYKKLEEDFSKCNSIIQQLVSSNEELKQEVKKLKRSLKRISVEDSPSKEVNMSKYESKKSSFAIKSSLDESNSIIQSHENSLLATVSVPKSNICDENNYFETFKSLQETSPEYGNSYQFSAKLLSNNFPKEEEVIAKTDRITKTIQELFNCISSEGQYDRLAPFSENVLTAVTNVISLFPEQPSNAKSDKEIRLERILNILKRSSLSLIIECKSDSRSTIDEIVRTSYEITKAAKQLIEFYKLP